MLYIMNVDWNWIKQRPHYLAEGLASKYKLIIVYQYRYKRNRLQKRVEDTLDLRPIFVLPKISGIKKLKWINEKIFANKIKRLINSNKPDIIFTTYPTHIDVIPEDYNGKIVYDCMDNHVEFSKDFEQRENLKIKEHLLVEKSDVVITSSLYLQKQIIEKYNICKFKTLLVRNAFNGKIIPYSNICHVNDVFSMAYIGTISNWFDWDTIKGILDNRNDVQFHLFGPLETEIPIVSPNIIYHGTIEHSKIYDCIKDMDCLIMPFIVNELIEAVDPVKIYEYINFNKNIIMSKYNEVERFKNFVYFYQTLQDFDNAIEDIKKTRRTKYSQKDRKSFLQENTWKNRIKLLLDLLETE